MGITSQSKEGGEKKIQKIDISILFFLAWYCHGGAKEIADLSSRKGTKERRVGGSAIFLCIDST